MRVKSTIEQAMAGWARTVGVVVLVGVASVACNTSVRGTGTPGSSGSGGTAGTDPAGGDDSFETGNGKTATESCQDFATRYAQRAEACGVDLDTAYDYFQGYAAGGHCEYATGFTNKTYLYGSCLPALKKISCSAASYGTPPFIPNECLSPFTLTY